MIRRTIIAIALAALAISPTAAADRTITLDVTGMTLAQVARLISIQTNKNIIVAPIDETTTITLHLHHVTPMTALSAIGKLYNLAVERHRGYILLTSATNQTHTMLLTTPADLATAVASLHLSTLTIAPVGSSSVLATGSYRDLARLQSIIAQLNQQYTSQTLNIAYSRPSTIVKKLATQLGKTTARIVPNDAESTITISGSRRSIRRIAKMVALDDTMPLRGSVDVMIVESQPANNSSNRGILWGLPAQSSAGGGTGGGSATTTPTLTAGTSFTTFASPSIPIAAEINELISEGKAKILSRPTIAFNSGGQADTNIGSTYPIATQNGGLVGGSTVQYEPVGIRLQLHMTIAHNGAMSGSIIARESTIQGFDPVSHLPILGNRSAHIDNLTIFPHESLVISGFFQNQRNDTIQKVPFLGDIPVLGQFFRDRQQSHQRLELSFILTPHLVCDVASLHPDNNTLKHTNIPPTCLH